MEIILHNCSVAIGSIRGEQHEDSFLIVIGYLDGTLNFTVGIQAHLKYIPRHMKVQPQLLP